MKKDIDEIVIPIVIAVIAASGALIALGLAISIFRWAIS